MPSCTDCIVDKLGDSHVLLPDSFHCCTLLPKFSLKFILAHFRGLLQADCKAVVPIRVFRCPFFEAKL